MTRPQAAALAVLCAEYVLVVFDAAAVALALPDLQAHLGTTPDRAQWVVSGYALAFAGGLLLGGRAADAFGRRRIFMLGVALFGAASLAGGLAESVEVLVAARIVQGAGGALASPAAFAILTTTFREGRQRNVAIGIWTATGGVAAVAAVLLGGLLTQFLGWEAVFLANVPIAAAALVAAPLLVRESRAEARPGFDLAGAALVTAGLVSLVFALAQAGTSGWESPRVAAGLAGAAVLLASFAAWERRARHPLLPPALARCRATGAAGVAGLLHGAMMLGAILLASLYLQDVLGFSPFEAGAALVAARITATAAAGPASRLATRVGAKPVVVAGMALMSAAFAGLARARADADYAVDVLPALAVAGIGISCLFVAVPIVALEGVADADAGVASGLLETSRWIGFAIALAAVSAFGLTPGADATSEAAASGLRIAFAACALVGAAGTVAALVLINGRGRVPAPAAAESSA
jgi:EmrB/QacA subfamily drug resistance transporter